MHHLSDLIRMVGDEYRNQKLLKYQSSIKNKQWITDRGSDLHNNIIKAAQGLAWLGVDKFDCVGIYSSNNPEFIYTEMGLFALRAISVPFYSTCSPEQVEQIANIAEVKVLFVGNQFQYNNVYYLVQKGSPIEHIIIYDRSVIKDVDDHISIYYDEMVQMGDAMKYESQVKSSIGLGNSHDIATLIFTSGTTGDPKGVQVTHGMLASQLQTHKEMFPSITTKDVSVNFLPLTHIFEKAWSYFCLYVGVKIVVVSDPKEIMNLMPQIKPTLMCNVPRYWEKVYQGVNEHIDRSPKFMRRIYQHAIAVGAKCELEYRNNGKQPPINYRLLDGLYKRSVFYLLKRVLGLQRGRFYPTAGAPLSDDINQFLQSAGFNIVVGYGLSESTATVSCYPQRGYVIGSIGEVIPNVSVRISPDEHEIQLKGDTITPGYYRNDKANQEAFTDDGWFRTGDIGAFEGNVLFFKERLKDLYKTSNGKYIAPQLIEGKLVANPIFEQVAVIADMRKYVTALIVPNWDKLRNLIKSEELIDDVELQSNCQLANNPTVIHLTQSLIAPLQSSLASYEKIKRIALLAEPFTIENGMLTNTLKLKRKVISQAYLDIIDKLYE